MKVLHILTSLNPIAGGVAKAVELSVQALKDVDHHSEVVCFDAADAKFLRIKDYKIHALGPAPNPYSYSPNFKHWSAQNLTNYEHIIIHGLWQYTSYGTYICWKKYAPKAALWVMPHGMLDPYFQKAKERRLKAIRNWFFWKLIERQVVNKSSGLLFTCKDELLLARTTFKPYHPKAEHVVGLGIPAPPTQAESFGEAFRKAVKSLNNRPYILFLGRIDSKKGVDLLVQAYIDLKKRRDELPDLVIAGPGLDSTYGRELLNLAAGEEQIHFPGMLQGAAKWGALYGAECFILPSHQENFGIAVVEALACELPVLISKQVNIWREIIAQKAGLAEADSLEGITCLLQDWIDLSKAQKIDMKANALKAYQQHFTTDAFGEQLKALFDR